MPQSAIQHRGQQDDHERQAQLRTQAQMKLQIIADAHAVDMRLRLPCQRFFIALRRRPFDQAFRCHMIRPPYAAPLVQQIAQQKLRLGITGVCGLAIPLHRLRIVLRHPQAVFIQIADIALRHRLALRGRAA